MAKSFKETLETLSKDTMVYMGTKQGSSWIEIDTAGEMLDKLDSLERLMCERIKNQHEKANSQIEKLPFTIIKIREQLNKQRKIELNQQLYNLEKEFYNAFALREKMSRILLNWVNVADRKVVEKYKHTSEPGVCILVEGQDMGTLWLKSEGPVIKNKK